MKTVPVKEAAKKPFLFVSVVTETVSLISCPLYFQWSMAVEKSGPSSCRLDMRRNFG
ncbi:hypothetical protein [Thiolapillus sp.]